MHQPIERQTNLFIQRILAAVSAAVPRTLGLAECVVLFVIVCALWGLVLFSTVSSF